MAKGVKVIKQLGNVHPATRPGSVVLNGGTEYAFQVTEWHAGTTEKDKDKLVWLLEDAKRSKVLLEHRSPLLNKISIANKYCGSIPLYYIEAGLSNIIDKSAVTNGFLVRGEAPPRIMKSKWTLKLRGDALGKTPIRYGDDVYLNVETEGLNGHRFQLEIYQRRGLLFSNPPIASVANVECNNGEINLLIRNTYSWYTKLKNGPSIAELYIMLKDESNQTYAIDNKKDNLHGRFLRVENKVVSRVVQSPQNVTVAKIGEPIPNPGRADHCRFTKIEVNDGDPVILFDEGKIKEKGATTKEFFIDEKIHYDFDQYTIKPAAKAILNKIAETLMSMPYIPVELGSHTDRFGSDAINNALSEKRAKAAMDYLISRNVDASRIVSKGYGKTMLVNKDPNLSKEASEVNRRTTIRLRIYSHDAQSLVFDTIGPGISVKKKIAVNISDFHTKGLCLSPSNPHIEEVPYSEITPGNQRSNLALSGGTTINPYLYSPMDSKLKAFTYIFPHKRKPNPFFFYINSCRYFSDKRKPSLIINVYSDIKWDFKFYLNMSDPLNVTWSNSANMSPSRQKELQESAAALGLSDYNKTHGIDWGVKLSSTWNKEGSSYKQKDEYTAKFKREIQTLYSVIHSLREVTRGITATTGGSPRKLGCVSKLPVILKVLAPKFAVGLEWKLARGSKRQVPTTNLGTEFKVYAQAEPLIGVELTIDLLELVIKGASVGFTGNPVAGDILIVVKDWLSRGYKSDRISISFDMYIDFVLTGKIGVSANGTINTASDKLVVEGKADAKLSGTIQAGLILKAKVLVVEAGPNKTDIHATGTVSASITVGVTASLSISCDTDKGLFITPGLVMDPCVGKVVVLVDVGFTWRKYSTDWRPINVNEEREFWKSFDIMKNLSDYSGFVPRICFPLNNND